VLLELNLRFAASANAASGVRAALEVLSRHLSPEVLSDARLLVTELVTNSLRHSGVGSEGSIGLALRLTPDRLRVTVRDPGPGLRVKIAEPTPEQEDGRGLVIIDRVAACWGVGDASADAPGPELGAEATVWFELATGAHRKVAA
jgi:anti-sigma regulatory factor (Ser/Thr protein kinase)